MKNLVESINGTRNSNCCSDCDGPGPIRFTNVKTPVLYIRKLRDYSHIKSAVKFY